VAIGEGRATGRNEMTADRADAQFVDSHVQIVSGGGGLRLER
jgi:hypothetical protein